VGVLDFVGVIVEVELLVGVEVKLRDGLKDTLGVGVVVNVDVKEDVLVIVLVGV
jgi:hypothetical protein